MAKPFKVRDFRHKKWFMMDDTYLNGYAKILGPHATCVYLSLCRHADNKEQSSFPSQELIAKEHSISRRTVESKIGLLREYNIIKTVRERSEKGRWSRNTYYLLDKSEWILPPSASPAHGQTISPSASDDSNHEQMTTKNHEQPVLTKGTHVEGYSIKDTEEYKKQRRKALQIRKQLSEKLRMKSSV